MGILGKGMHAQFAEKGVNAIHRYLLALEAMGYPTKAARFVKDNLEGHLLQNLFLVMSRMTHPVSSNSTSVRLNLRKRRNPVHRYAPSRDLSKGKGG
ncbi:hypothetical protein M5E89_14085 [Acidaminococcus intestini]|nr:hypothetical protein M5E89_14085 [Acidaminococcus intestini]